MNVNKVVIVTGASRGIGAATAKLFAHHGYAVCLNYVVNQQAVDKVAAEITGSGGQCISVAADVSREEGVLALFESVDKAWGRLDVLVNNAAILRQQCRLQDVDEQRITDILRVNVAGCMLCCREAVKRMSTRQGGNGGAIVNVSSMAAKKGSPNEYIDYAASKGAVDTLTVGLSQEVAGEGIRVNGVRPGLIYTDMHASGGEPGRVDRLKDKIPMQRGGQATEVAEAIYWLASEQASYATGSFIDLAGGF